VPATFQISTQLNEEKKIKETKNRVSLSAPKESKLQQISRKSEEPRKKSDNGAVK
jgi:hypothetical protein